MDVLTYVGEIRMFAGSKPPGGWLLCDGTIYSISDQERLFTSIGTYYGGDGVSTFAVPNLCGRVPVNIGAGPGTPSLRLSELAGSETVGIALPNLPAHNHPVNGTTATAAAQSPGGNLLGTFASGNAYVTRATDTPIVAMNDASISNTGTGVSAPIVQPYVAVNYIIATDGRFTPPSL